MTKKNLIPSADICGLPYDLGYQHGKIFKEKVTQSIQTYKKMFKNNSNLSWDNSRKLALSFKDAIEEYNSDYIKEMEGLADGSGYDFEDILALNCRSEIALQGTYTDPILTDGCTVVAISPEKSDNGHIYAAHNWDWKKEQKSAMVLLNIKQKNDRPDIHLITEAGIIGKAGCNSAGLSLFLNALSVDSVPKGVPLHIVMRGILDSKNLNEAVRAATKRQLGCCANFLICHESGEILDIEISNNDFEILFPKNGSLVHTNHFTSSKLPRPPYTDQFKRIMPDTYLRKEVADRYLNARNHISLQNLMEIMGNHTGHPGSICRHQDRYAEEKQKACTIFSIIIDLTDKRMYFSFGNPCKTEYEIYTFDEDNE